MYCRIWLLALAYCYSLLAPNFFYERDGLADLEIRETAGSKKVALPTYWKFPFKIRPLYWG